MIKLTESFSTTANPGLSARAEPVLNDIFSLLEPLANNPSQSVRPLALEARMVMTARLASTPGPRRPSKNADEEDVQEIYQKALKLLQDPILPVRAHGLLLLRQLVSQPSNSPDKRQIDPALVPAILSVFLQSVQDDDSYMFLNAVQGLAAMVDTFGKDVLRALIKVYSQGLDGIGGTTLTQHELDTRIRVGEALGQVIRRCGDALSIYGTQYFILAHLIWMLTWSIITVDILLPPLFNLVRSSHIPTTLRTSALSLLAESENTNSLSLLPYATTLFEAMIDLLQIESVPAIDRSQMPSEGEAKDKEGDRSTVTMDSHPTSMNSKFPPLRRAALHFLSLLLQASTLQAYDSPSQAPQFESASMKRARTTLAYVASTDEDIVVRVMSREALESLEQLGRAMMGI